MLKQTLHMMISPLVIRKARREDVPALCELLEELFSIEKDFSHNPEAQTSGLRLLVDDPSGRSLILVAEEGSEVIGMCSVQLVISTAEGGWAGIVEDLVVREDKRNSGIGTRLLTEVGDWCREKGVARIQLLCDWDNRPALDFYAVNGWRATNLIALRKFH